MSRQNRARLLGLALALAVTLPTGQVSGSTGIRAVMDGKPITLKEAETLSCHDFDFPVLTCFADSAQMEKAAAERFAERKAMAVASSGYVVVFEHGAYAGATRTISQSYSYLGDIGFNDKISSFKSYGATGRFYDNAPPGGLVYSFGGSTWVSYVGDTYNDKFSSVDLF